MQLLCGTTFGEVDLLRAAERLVVELVDWSWISSLCHRPLSPGKTQHL
jgi:hypothetical protein